MSIISSYCTSNPELVDRFTQASKGTEMYELRRLAQEVNASFGLEVVKITSSSPIRPCVHFVTADGIWSGSGSVTKDGIKDNQTVYRYYITLPTIAKDKASANSSRDTRDSVNLSALIRTIKKNKEEPSSEKLLRTMNEGAKYTMRAVANNARSRPNVTFDSDTTLAVTRFVLGVDSSIPNAYINTLREKFDQFQSQMKSFQAANADYNRYTRGVTLVCINTVDSEPHYLVGDATFDTANDCFVFQGGLKRYNSLADSPVAPTATMIKTFMQGGPCYDNSNELGVMRQDKYFQDIDIAVGYSRAPELWVAIPKNAQ